jgi:transposase
VSHDPDHPFHADLGGDRAGRLSPCIDGLAATCRQQLERDPMNGWAFVFRNRRATAVKILMYDLCGVPNYVELR